MYWRGIDGWTLLRRSPCPGGLGPGRLNGSRDPGYVIFYSRTAPLQKTWLVHLVRLEISCHMHLAIFENRKNQKVTRVLVIFTIGFVVNLASVIVVLGRNRPETLQQSLASPTKPSAATWRSHAVSERPRPSVSDHGHKKDVTM